MTPCLLTSCRTIEVLHTQRYAAVVCGAPIREDTQRLIVTEWVLFAFAITSVILRFVSRAPYFGGNLGWDDWPILMLLGLQLAINITGIFLVYYGLGQDIWMLEEYQIITIFKVFIPPSRSNLSLLYSQVTRPVVLRR